MTRRRRRRKDGTLLYGMAAGMFLTLLITAGLDVASRRGVSLRASLLDPASATATIAPASELKGAIRPSDASRISVDGKERRANAAGLVETAPGRHRVEIVNPAGDVWVTAVTVTAGSIIDVKPRWSGELIVDAEAWPETAALTLDGAACGAPPLVLDELSVGEHRLAMTDGGEVRWEQAVTVKAGGSRRVVIPVVEGPAVPAPAEAAMPAPGPDSGRALDTSADAPAWTASIEPQLP